MVVSCWLVLCVKRLLISGEHNTLFRYGTTLQLRKSILPNINLLRPLSGGGVNLFRK